MIRELSRKENQTAWSSLAELITKSTLPFPPVQLCRYSAAAGDLLIPDSYRIHSDASKACCLFVVGWDPPFPNAPYICMNL